MTANPYAEAVEAAARAMSDDWNPDRDPILTAMLRDYAASAVAAAVGPLLAPLRALADEWEADGEGSAFWGAHTRLRMVLDAIEAGATSEGGQS